MATNASAGIHGIDSLLGKTIISRSSGNKLGEISDLILEPAEGLLLGLVVQPSHEDSRIIDSREITSFGEDAVMVNNDNALMNLQDSSLSAHPHAKKDLTGTKIISEGGKLLGEIANIVLLTNQLPVLVI